MTLQIRQTLRQTQQLVMTAQLQQAIKLLQYNHQEMIGVVEQELRENPVLEVGPDEESILDKEAADRNDLTSLEDLVKEPENPRADILEEAWENYLETYGADRTPINRDLSDRPPLDNLAKSSENLFHYLLRQLQLSHIEGQDRIIALELIGNIDENGYLDLDLDELARSRQVDKARVEHVLRLVQEFDPPGIASRDLRECLLNQAAALEPPDELVTLILRDAFDLFERGQLDRVARKLKVAVEEVERAARIISSFDPKPGRPFSNTDIRYVIPDVFVFKVGNDYTVELNDDGLPRLKISPFYQRQLHSNLSYPGAKDYIQEKLRGAMWLIKSIHQRQRTIQKVATSIIKFQREFFDKGIDFLKPLVLRDVANDVEMHESTISRVTANKYMHTPRGIFELKYFFNSGIRQGAESIASESVKNQILRIIRNEEPRRPISDHEIVLELAGFNIQIARRTVTKYREMMGIPSSSKRRKKF